MMEYALHFLGVVLYPFMLIAIIYELYMIRLKIERLTEIKRWMEK